MKRLLGILFWSVLTAAFIGPGTVTTAAKGGHDYGLSLLWALSFSIFSCIVLQEAAARVTIVSGEDLGRALRRRYLGTSLAIPVFSIVVGAILVGCAAFEMGNLLGGVAGLALLGEVPSRVAPLLLGILAATLLWFGSSRFVAKLLGCVVAVMGILFVVTAVGLSPNWSDVIEGAIVPTLPAGSPLLVAALIGTTVVPYNLFLGSGIARDQSLADVRFGLVVALVLGGIISMAVLVVGTEVVGKFGYAEIAIALEARLGSYAPPFFGIGLFAAGMSSAITAPLAAAITARSLFAADDKVRSESTRLYRGTWIAVLATGVLFASIGVKPIPAIVLAQATNGILLPFVAIFLFIAVNDRRTMGDDGRNGWVGNALLVIVIGVTLLLGTTNVYHAFRPHG